MNGGAVLEAGSGGAFRAPPTGRVLASTGLRRRSAPIFLPDGSGDIAENPRLDLIQFDSV